MILKKKKEKRIKENQNLKNIHQKKLLKKKTILLKMIERMKLIMIILIILNVKEEVKKNLKVQDINAQTAVNLIFQFLL